MRRELASVIADSDVWAELTDVPPAIIQAAVIVGLVVSMPVLVMIIAWRMALP